MAYEDRKYGATTVKPLRLKGSLSSVSEEAKKLGPQPAGPTGLPVAGAQETPLFGPLVNPLIDAGSTLAKKTFDATGLGQAAKAVPAIYDASKTVGYNAARLIDEQFPKGFDAIEKGVGVVSDAVKEGFDATGIPYVYDKAKARLQLEDARTKSTLAGVKNIYGQLTKPIPQ
jgi:hypothetical protein